MASRGGDFVYLTLPPGAEVRSCLGLVVAGMSARARIGVGNMDEFVETLERLQAGLGKTVRFRFLCEGDRITAEVESPEAGGWRTVAELVA